jgi:hypothetical protein
MTESHVHRWADVEFVSFGEDWEAGALHDLPSYLTGNQRVLAHQGVDGAVWALSAQLASLTGSHERHLGDGLEALYFCNGIEGRHGPACWYEIELDDDSDITRASTRDARYHHRTGYLHGLFPHTSLSVGLLDVTVSTMAPVQDMGEGDTWRPPAILYQIQLTNKSSRARTGWIHLHIRGEAYLVQGGADQWHRVRQSFRCEESGLILALRSDGLPDLLFWSEDATLIDAGPRPGVSSCFQLAPDETQSFRVWVALERAWGDPDNSSLSRLRKMSAERWMSSTTQYWERRLGTASVSPPTPVSAFLRRGAQECFYCIRVNDLEEVVGVVPSPVPIEESSQLSDILFVCMPVLDLEPTMYARVIAWYVEEYAALEAALPLDTQARVVPAIMAGLLYQRTGDTAFFSDHPKTVTGIERLLESVVTHKDGTSGLFPTDVLHGYEPLIQFELGTNIECWAAFHWWAEVLDGIDMHDQAGRWRTCASETKEAIRQSFATTGPGKGGWHYAGLRLVAEYRLDPLHYYEHDALDVAIAPLLGFCSVRHRPWRNAIEHMFSPFYELVQSRPTTAVWWKPTLVGERKEKRTAPSVVARLAAVHSDQELDRAVLALERAIDMNGVFWLQSTADPERRMRSGREMGAAHAVLTRRLMGLQVDMATGRITYHPWNPWRETRCEQRIAQNGLISAWQACGRTKAQAEVANRTTRDWMLQLGFTFSRSLEVIRVWLDGQLWCDEVEVQEGDGSSVYWLECNLPAGARVTAVIEARKSPPPDFAEAGAIA